MTKAENHGIETVVKAISRLIAADIAQYGDSRLSMGTLRNAFDSAIYGYVKSIGAKGQLAILSDNEELLAFTANTARRFPEDTSVGSVIQKSLYDALRATMEPKMVDMCHRLHENRIGPVLGKVAEVADTMMKLQFRGCPAETLQAANDFGSSAAAGNLPTDIRSGLVASKDVVDALRSVQREKRLLEQLGVSVAEVARLANAVTDLLELETRDPAKFASAARSEAAARAVPQLALAA